MSDVLRIVPLGGLGEVGKNMDGHHRQRLSHGQIEARVAEGGAEQDRGDARDDERQTAPRQVSVGSGSLSGGHGLDHLELGVP